jgi:hypothetical protein
MVFGQIMFDNVQVWLDSQSFILFNYRFFIFTIGAFQPWSMIGDPARRIFWYGYFLSFNEELFQCLLTRTWGCNSNRSINLSPLESGNLPCCNFCPMIEEDGLFLGIVFPFLQLCDDES